MLENTKINGFLVLETAGARLNDLKLAISNTTILGEVYKSAPIELPSLLKRLKNSWYDMHITPYIRAGSSVTRAVVLPIEGETPFTAHMDIKVLENALPGVYFFESAFTRWDIKFFSNPC